MSKIKQPDPRWTDEQIEQAARIQRSDVARALQLISEASPELAEMVEAKEERKKEEREKENR